jgi:hypothetical protein
MTFLLDGWVRDVWSEGAHGADARQRTHATTNTTPPNKNHGPHNAAYQRRSSAVSEEAAGASALNKAP